MKSKFGTNTPKVIQGQELLSGLDTLAQSIIDEMNGHAIPEEGAAGTGEKLAALKTVASYVAMKNKLQSPFEEGSAFGEYRNKTKSATAAGGTGNPGRGDGTGSGAGPSLSLLTFGRNSQTKED